MNELMERYPALAVCRDDIAALIQTLETSFRAGGKLLLCGNGGSCADCDHITGELLKGFMKKRPLSPQLRQALATQCPDLNPDKLQQGLPAISLPALTALNTAFCNDVEPAHCFAQSVLALGKPGDILICISTSGNAVNVNAAAQVAKATGLTVLALTGETGGALRAVADCCICAPRNQTYQVQELHLPIYHYLCAAVESHFFPE
jgi:D-sedoheptulose 7-phosphate isomerase